MIELRLQALEKRVARLETSSTLNVHSRTIGENIFAWFENHHVLVVTQFQYEMQALGLQRGANAIREAVYVYNKQGKIRRIERGVYVDNRQNMAAVGHSHGYIGRDEPVDFNREPIKSERFRGNSNNSSDSQKLRNEQRHSNGLLSVDRG